jgi:tetratricopeptide (TPR) repeat protein
MEHAPATAWYEQCKVFRPLLWWAILSLVLLTWQFHRRREQQASIKFMVSMEGRTSRPAYRAELNDLPFDSGRHSGLWRKKLTIEAEDAESFTTNFFVWYGGKDLGHIALKRNRGVLDLRAVPIANQLTVEGAEVTNKFEKLAHESLSLPTGRYRITSAFTRFAAYREIEIVAHQTNRLVIDPNLTSLSLISQPANAEFELIATSMPEVTIHSNTPALLNEMPAGNYQLRIWRNDYEKTVPLKLNPALPTNTFTVEFDYAQLSINSTPDGADINEGNKFLGTTPATLTIPTGQHRLTVTKTGFNGTNFVLTLERNEKRSLAVTLPNRAYLEAIDQARRQLSGAFPDLDAALESADEALRIQPNDPTALQLQRSILFQRNLRAAREFRQNGAAEKAEIRLQAALQLRPNDPDALALKRDLDKDKQSVAQAQAEKRREHPAQLFQERVKGLQYADLFPSQKMEVTGQLVTARASLLRALGKNPTWNIQRNDKADEDTAIIQADTKSFGSRQSVFIVVSQTSENTVEVHFKLWLFALGNNIQLTLGGIPDESYHPLHSSYAPPERSASIEQRRARGLQEFRKRLDAELR